MLNCKEASVLVSQSRDRRLRWSERLALRLHLWICDQCRRFERQVAWLGSLGRVLESSPEKFVPADADLSAETRERIRREIEAHRAAGCACDTHQHPQ